MNYDEYLRKNNLKKDYPDFQKDFDEFFPDMIAHADSFRASL